MIGAEVKIKRKMRAQEKQKEIAKEKIPKKDNPKKENDQSHKSIIAQKKKNILT